MNSTINAKTRSVKGYKGINSENNAKNSKNVRLTSFVPYATLHADIVDKVPEWVIAGHRKASTGRPPGRPKSAKDSRPRKLYERRRNLPAVT